MDNRDDFEANSGGSPQPPEESPISPAMNEADLFGDSGNEEGSGREGGQGQEGVGSGGSDDEEEKEEKRKRDEKKKAKGPVNRRVISEEMLTGPNGLCKLPEIFKDFQPREKSRVKEDLALVLTKLELWIHRLHPKQQFDQSLQRIEFLGKRKVIKAYMEKIRRNMIGVGDADMNTAGASNGQTSSSSTSLPQDAPPIETEQTDGAAGPMIDTLDEPIDEDEDVVMNPATTEEFHFADEAEPCRVSRSPDQAESRTAEDTLDESMFPDDDDDFLALCAEAELGTNHERE